MKASDLKGLFAIIPTPARPGADRLDARDTVAVDETAKACLQPHPRWCTRPHRSRDDRRMRHIVERRLPHVRRLRLQNGGEADSGLRRCHSARRARIHTRLTFAQEQGADGTLLGLPMWQPCTTDMAVKFYADVSGAFPKLPIMVYANARAFRFSFPPEFWARVADEAPTVIAAKSSHARSLKENQQATSHAIHFMPPDMTVAEFFKLSPEHTTACWATAAGMGPEPCVAIMNAVLAKDDRRANICRTGSPGATRRSRRFFLIRKSSRATTFKSKKHGSPRRAIACPVRRARPTPFSPKSSGRRRSNAAAGGASSGQRSASKPLKLTRPSAAPRLIRSGYFRR